MMNYLKSALHVKNGNHVAILIIILEAQMENNIVAENVRKNIKKSINYVLK